MKNILVLDTETAGELTNPLIYDFGYKIITPKGEVLISKNYVVAEIFDSQSLMTKAYYGSKVGGYRERIEKGEIEKKGFKAIIKEFVNDAKRNRVEIVSAYNLAFDVRALNETLRVCHYDAFVDKWLEKFLYQKNKKLLCIWNLACETILNTDEYREFATENDLISPKGNYRTSAEASFRYIKNLPDFVESHTALADVEIEIEILLNILENYSGIMTYGLHYGSWQKVQKRKKDE